MEEADKMFEELGYIKLAPMMAGVNTITAYKKTDDEGLEFRIEFCINEKLVGTYCEVSNVVMPASLTMDELKAINKKCEELGWIQSDEGDHIPRID